MTPSILTVDTVSSAYGDIHVLEDINLAVGQDELVALVGSNGAGKTTLLKTISGLLHPVSGEIKFKGEPIGGLTSDGIVRKGISCVPEGRGLFQGLTVEENLMMGAYVQRNKETIIKTFNLVCEMFPVLRERLHQLAGTFSGGEQQMCAIARALMSSPKLLMVDELSLGLAPTVVEHLAEKILDLRDSGLSILLVEQNVEMSLALADRAYILERGRIVMEGSSSELIDDTDIRKLYFGVELVRT